jgi:hypothetical protein
MTVVGACPGGPVVVSVGFVSVVVVGVAVGDVVVVGVVWT